MLKWKGMLSYLDEGMRRRLMSMLLLVCISMIVTQLSYIVVEDAHFIFVLAPVVAASLLFGTLAGTVIGGITGLMVMIHARTVPYDVYERYFQSPITSILLFSLIGFFMGFMYFLVDRYRGEKGWRRPTSIALSCLLGSLLFSSFFQGAAYLTNSYLSIPVPSKTFSQLMGPFAFFTQFLTNLAVIAICSIAIDKLHEVRLQRRGPHSLRMVFGGWLIISVMVGYVGIMAISYGFVSIACKDAAEKTLQSQIAYIKSELTNREKVFGSMARHSRLSNTTMSQISSSTISGLSASMGLENECLVALADNGIIVATNIEDALGKGFLQKVGSGFTYGFDESLFEEKTASDWYLEDGSMCYFRASEMGYVRGADSGIYQIMAVMKTADVYRNRAITMLLLALGFFLILGLIFIQAHILVDDLVVKPMRDACQALDEIAKGSSERKVDERDTNEFIELSDSINNAIDSVRQQRERPRHT